MSTVYTCSFHLAHFECLPVPFLSPNLVLGFLSLYTELLKIFECSSPSLNLEKKNVERDFILVNTFKSSPCYIFSVRLIENSTLWLNAAALKKWFGVDVIIWNITAISVLYVLNLQITLQRCTSKPPESCVPAEAACSFAARVNKPTSWGSLETCSGQQRPPG